MSEIRFKGTSRDFGRGIFKRNADFLHRVLFLLIGFTALLIKFT